ncbi:MAG: DNA methyltransferase [Chloroflexota bacterium]|nr:DNA methyltransferase [Chloroflexota bacterium]
MAGPNFANRTLWTGDNLDILRGINSECVDLIYLDPPFNSNQDYSAPVGSAAAGAAFKDTWTLSDVDDAWHGMIAESHPALYGIIDAARPAHGKGMKSYLIMMAVRLLELHRVLKDTGSVYLHCDDTASHYLKLLMDSVFGAGQFRNHLIWRRATAHNDPRRFGRNVDHILYYGKGQTATWNGAEIATPKTDDEIRKAYPQTDERGPVRSENLTGPLHGTSPGLPSTTPWKGYDVYARGRCWSPPKTGAYAVYIERHFIPGYRSIEGVQERLDALDDAGLIHHPTTGVWPGLKRYAAADRGNPPQSLILDPTGFTNFNKGSEWVGYPTQKPLALLERIIAASSNPGDVVLDPFCGCATALVAAEKLERQWVGIDLSPKAKDLVELRLRNNLGLFGLQTTYREDVPRRTDLGEAPPYRTQKHTLFGKQEGLCAGCRVMFPFRNFTIDHIIPQSRGGTDHLDNLQLLCGACNSMKGDRPQEYLLARLREAGIL